MKKSVSDLQGFELDFLVAKIEGCNSCRIINTWLFMGPIIEREKIELIYDYELNLWVADIDNNIDSSKYEFVTGSTPLIAAMRCFVAAKFGEYVEIEDEKCG
jgi:hypothetical protein